MTERLRIGVVGLKGSWSTEALANAVAEHTGFRLVVDASEMVADLRSGNVEAAGVNLCELDALMVKKIGDAYGVEMLDRLDLLRYVNERGVPVFSRPSSISRLLNRLSCTITLSSAGIPMPETCLTEDVERALEAVQRQGRSVLKPLYSTKARGMLVLSGEEPRLLERLLAYREAGNALFYVQRMLPGLKRDLGVVFLGGEYVGTYARVRTSEAWNTTIREGGRYEACEPSPEVIDLAERAQSQFGLDLTSVDVVETAEGPLVFEVSAFGGFRGSQVALGIDLADRYVRYVLSRVGR